jgi:hypothetical protein
LSFQEILGNFWNLWSGWRVLAQKTGALAKFGNFSRIYVDFWSGLGPFYKYFSEAEGPIVCFPNAQGLQRNLQQGQGTPCKIAGGAHNGHVSASPAAGEEDEQDEVVPEGCSLEHKLWRRGGAMMVKGSGSSNSV